MLPPGGDFDELFSGVRHMATGLPSVAVVPKMMPLTQAVADFSFNGLLQHLLSTIAKSGFEQALTDLACVEVDGFGCLSRGGCVHLGAFH